MTVTLAPLTTVIIPTWNQAGKLAACLRAVRDTADCRVIVVDNGSTDDTKDLLDSFREVLYLRNEDNLGFAAACNRGASSADTPAVCFLNNDAYPRAGWLDALERYLPTAIAGAQLIDLEGQLQHAGIEFPSIQSSTFENGQFRMTTHWFPRAIRRAQPCSPVAAVTGACMLIARERFMALGGFCEDFRNGYEDVDFCLRAQKAGTPVWYEPAAVVVHEGHGSGMSERTPYLAHNAKLLAARWGIG